MKKRDRSNFIKVKNDSRGRELIALLQKLTKDCNSKYSIILRGRNPIKTSKWNGRRDLPIEESQEIAIYLKDRVREKEDRDRYDYSRDQYKRGLELGQELLKDKIIYSINNINIVK